jgi:serine protease Do
MENNNEKVYSDSIFSESANDSSTGSFSDTTQTIHEGSFSDTAQTTHESSYTEPVRETTNNNNTSYSNQNYSYNQYGTQPNYPKKKSGKFKRTLSYIAVGVICTILGGAASGAAMLYVLPNTSIFRDSSFYKALESKATSTSHEPANDNHPTQLAVTGEALTVAEIARRVGPAVVAITTTVQGEADFFGRPSVGQATGTGMIINKDGYILTNAHVVQGAQNLKIMLSNGKKANGRVVNSDATYDVAVVKITDQIEIPAVVELGDSSSLQVGESVVAIGNPLGTNFFGSVTTGVVSALNRKIENDQTSYIQTDAAINSGNSGGPLINSRGQVIGINTAKIKDDGVEGLGFAIPIDAVKNKIPDLSKPVLLIGIQGTEVGKELAQQYDLAIGIYVNDIQQFSPAERAGIKRGDVIVKFDGEKVTTFAELNNLKNKHKVGDTIAVTVNRDGTEETLSLKLTEQK